MTVDPQVHPEELLAVALEAARAAAEIIIAAADLPKAIKFKGATDLVTVTDREAETTITTIIKKHFPEHRILAEESGRWAGTEEYLWVIDPLDGTTNFVHGYPAFAVSIGVLQADRPVCGVIAELPAGHFYSAVRSGGACRDGRPIAVSGNDDLQQALLVTGFGYDHDEHWRKNMVLFRELTDRTQGVRRQGAAAIDLAHVASGKVDGYWEFDLHPWDSAAGILLVEEAGGRVSRMDGKPYSIFDDQLLASNGHLHDTLLDIIVPVISKSAI
ncbi:MAG: inositol monophosphatase family protein [Candidatus Neomarinimicrobiota bacterium]